MSAEPSDPYDAADPRHVGLARKLEAEADLALASAAKARWERESEEARARCAFVDAEKAEIDLDRARRLRDKELAANEFHHVYHFAESVSAGSVKSCMVQLSTWHRLDTGCAVEIVFSSPGGSVIDGMALFDYIQELRREGHVITTGARGMAASMAGILLQAGDRRWIGREAYLLIHEVQAGAVGKVGEMEDEMELIHKMCDRILGIFADRCHLTTKQLAVRWRRKDWWLDSTEALKLGFVDEVR